MFGWLRRQTEELFGRSGAWPRVRRDPNGFVWQGKGFVPMTAVSVSVSNGDPISVTVDGLNVPAVTIAAGQTATVTLATFTASQVSDFQSAARAAVKKFWWLCLCATACLPTAQAAEQLVMFTAPWCPACQTAKADLNADQSLTGGRQLEVIDVEQQPSVARQRGVRTLPTFIVTENGREVRRLAGYPGRVGFRRWSVGQ